MAGICIFVDLIVNVRWFNLPDNLYFCSIALSMLHCHLYIQGIVPVSQTILISINLWALNNTALLNVSFDMLPMFLQGWKLLTLIKANIKLMNLLIHSLQFLILFVYLYFPNGFGYGKYLIRLVLRSEAEVQSHGLAFSKAHCIFSPGKSPSAEISLSVEMCPRVDRLPQSRNSF